VCKRRFLIVRPGLDSRLFLRNTAARETTGVRRACEGGAIQVWAFAGLFWGRGRQVFFGPWRVGGRRSSWSAGPCTAGPGGRETGQGRPSVRAESPGSLLIACWRQLADRTQDFAFDWEVCLSMYSRKLVSPSFRRSGLTLFVQARGPGRSRPWGRRGRRADPVDVGQGPIFERTSDSEG